MDSRCDQHNDVVASQTPVIVGRICKERRIGAGAPLLLELVKHGDRFRRSNRRQENVSPFRRVSDALDVESWRRRGEIEQVLLDGVSRNEEAIGPWHHAESLMQRAFGVGKCSHIVPLLRRIVGGNPG